MTILQLRTNVTVCVCNSGTVLGAENLDYSNFVSKPCAVEQLCTTSGFNKCLQQPVGGNALNSAVQYLFAKQEIEGQLYTANKSYIMYNQTSQTVHMHMNLTWWSII